MRSLILALPLEPLLAVHAAATWYMVGVVWTVQLVHYPLMARVGGAGWSDYAAAHRRRMTGVVLAPMLIELSSAVALALRARWDERVASTLALAGVALVVSLWLATFLVQVPLHERLSGTFEPGAHARLVRTNWLRTLAWTARGALALALLR